MRDRPLRPCMGKDEGAGAVGRLGVAGRDTGLADGGGLLVAGHAADRNGRAEQARLAETARTIDDFGTSGARNVEQAEKRIIPPAGDDIHQRRARSEEPTSELQSLMRTSYAVFCLKKKKETTNTRTPALNQ